MMKQLKLFSIITTYDFMFTNVSLQYFEGNIFRFWNVIKRTIARLIIPVDLLNFQIRLLISYGSTIGLSVADWVFNFKNASVCRLHAVYFPIG